MVALVAEALIFRPSLQAAFVINRRVARTVIGRETHEALLPHRMSIMATQVFQRIVFAESVAAGRLAFELNDDSHAAREIAWLGAEVLSKAP